MRKVDVTCPLKHELRKLVNGPIRLEPNTIEHIYNGGKLRAEFVGEPNATDDFRSEEWIFSTNRAVTPGKVNPPKKGYSKVKLNGLTFTLDLLLREFPEETVGTTHFREFGPELGVLLKIFDVGEGETIPIHAHPTPEFAKEHLGSDNGKNEAWIILGIRDEGIAWVGWKEPVEKDSLKALMYAMGIEEIRSLMHEVKLEVGDVLSIPAGMMHAMGPGVCVLEPQEPTDFSILLEWQRFQITEEEANLGLGWDKALGAVSLEALEWPDLQQMIAPEPETTLQDYNRNTIERIIADSLQGYFWADRVTVTTALKAIRQGFHCITITQGSGHLLWGESSIPIKRGQSFFIPASIANSYTLVSGGGKLEVIRCFP